MMPLVMSMSMNTSEENIWCGLGISHEGKDLIFGEEPGDEGDETDAANDDHDVVAIQHGCTSLLHAYECIIRQGKARSHGPWRFLDAGHQDLLVHPLDQEKVLDVRELPFPVDLGVEAQVLVSVDDFGEEDGTVGVTVMVPAILHQFIDLDGEVLREETEDVVQVDEDFVHLKSLWLEEEPFPSHVLSVS